jgi:Orsellinic acid/F9775 biosynthesis cluster protein D
MPQDLSDFGVIHCPNGHFIWCFTCKTVVGALGPFFLHLRGKPHNIVKSKLKELLQARPDLNAIVEESAKANNSRLPERWPDDVPPIADIKVTPGYECLLCPPAKPCRRRPEKSIKDHLTDEHDMPWQTKVEGVHFQQILMQTWFPRMMGGMGIWWRVDFSKPRHELYQRPLFDESINAHNAQYRLRMHQFLLLGTPSKEEAQLQSTAVDSLGGNAPSLGVPVPKDPLAEAQLTGTQLKDDRNAFVEAAGWRQAFKRLPYVEAM